MTRVLVVGHGMVAARFLTEMASRRVPDVELVVIGEEPRRPYNRLLLAEVLTGVHDLESLTLAETAGVEVVSGRRACAIDRARRVVVDDFGAEHRYDVLVLATGAAPRFPTIDGLIGADDQPLPGVTALRAWEDAEVVQRRIAEGSSIVVLGGGLLGVEAARALAQARVGGADGPEVTIIHRQSHPLDRQLDAVSGTVLRAGLADLGVTTRTDVRIAHVTRTPDRIQALRLSDGKTIGCDLVLVAAGVRPRTRLATAADLWVRVGILVDDRCATDDPFIYAIGDCAETSEGCPGLVAPGWAQARVLADELADRFAAEGARGRPRVVPDTETSADSVVRLKADGLDVVTMGSLPADDLDLNGPRVVSMVDLAGRRRVRVAVSEGRIVGATCVGDSQVAADLTVAFENRFPVPDDPAALLARPLSQPSASVAACDLPGHATICRCNAVSKDVIMTAIGTGARSVEAVAESTRATTGCGTCASQVCELLDAAGELRPAG